MKTPAEILAKTENGLPKPSWTSRTPTGNAQIREEQADYRNQEQGSRSQIPQHTKALVNMIFARFLAIYGHKFRSCFESQDELILAKREWALSLVDYSESQMVAAINACKEKCEWMPTIAEFLREIKQAQMPAGLPDVYTAYQEACMHGNRPNQHNWSHEVVYHAGKSVGWFDLLSSPQSEVLPRFTYAYERACERLVSGEGFDEPVVQALTDRSDASSMTAMLAWAQANGLTKDQGAQLLFYQTKPVGTDIRSRLYHKAQAQAKALGVDLPALHQNLS